MHVRGSRQLQIGFGPAKTHSQLVKREGAPSFVPASLVNSENGKRPSQEPPCRHYLHFHFDHGHARLNL